MEKVGATLKEGIRLIDGRHVLGSAVEFIKIALVREVDENNLSYMC